MENTNTSERERVYTKSAHIYPSEKSNCGILPDEDGFIVQFGESKELYPPKYIKVLVNNELDKIEIAKALRKLADILEGKREIKYEEWFLEQLANN